MEAADEWYRTDSETSRQLARIRSLHRRHPNPHMPLACPYTLTTSTHDLQTTRPKPCSRYLAHDFPMLDLPPRTRAPLPAAKPNHGSHSKEQKHSRIARPIPILREQIRAAEDLHPEQDDRLLAGDGSKRAGAAACPDGRHARGETLEGAADLEGLLLGRRGHVGASGRRRRE